MVNWREASLTSRSSDVRPSAWTGAGRRAASPDTAACLGAGVPTPHAPDSHAETSQVTGTQNVARHDFSRRIDIVQARPVSAYDAGVGTDLDPHVRKGDSG